MIISAKQLTPLIEIILAMAFFAGTSTILIQVFSKAHADSRLAHDINNATLLISECIEQIRRADSFDAVTNVLDIADFEKDDNEHIYRVYLDSSFLSTLKDSAYSTIDFVVHSENTKAGQLVIGQFVCIRGDGKELVSMDTAVFFAKSVEP